MHLPSSMRDAMLSAITCRLMNAKVAHYGSCFPIISFFRRDAGYIMASKESDVLNWIADIVLELSS